jgi:hypothetical protein
VSLRFERIGAGVCDTRLRKLRRFETGEKRDILGATPLGFTENPLRSYTIQGPLGILALRYFWPRAVGTGGQLQQRGSVWELLVLRRTYGRVVFSRLIVPYQVPQLS